MKKNTKMDADMDRDRDMDIDTAGTRRWTQTGNTDEDKDVDRDSDIYRNIYQTRTEVGMRNFFLSP